MLTRSLSTGFVGLALIFSVPLAAQDRILPPTDVSVVADGGSAVVTWTPVQAEGVTYRVVRTLDVRRTGVDITDPTAETRVLDGKIEAGVTYYYQVIAVYRDATTAGAAFVTFSAPAAVVAPSTVLTPITEVAPIRVEMPTAVMGVTIEGNTTVSALVSWQPVPGASSYSIRRSYSVPGGFADRSATAVKGLTTTSWNDLGPQGVGFQYPGIYAYEVTAILPFGSVSGQGAWKRPDPTCAEPSPTQQPLTVLDPTTLVAFRSTLPVGGFLWWQSGWTRNGAIALRIDRSVQGSGVWALAASSCAGTIPAINKDAALLDQIKGVRPNTTYLYKFTAFAANGEVGLGTLPWTSPNTAVIHWLSATSSGSTVTLNFRYEPPATNPPKTPDLFRVTAAYGLNQAFVGDGLSCAKLNGCTLVITGVPSGTHIFTAMARWVDGNVVSLHTPTTVVVP